MRYTIIIAMMFTAFGAQAAEHANWQDYVKANRYSCPGPLDTLAEARTFEAGGKKYVQTGYRVEVEGADEDKHIKIGVLSASKDLSDFTRKNLEQTLAWFKQEGAEWIVANGDLAIDEFDFEEFVEILAKTQLPTLIVLGNSDSRGGWARIYRSMSKKYPNLFDGTLVRQIVADDAEFWTISGYHNKAFIHQTGACSYKTEDVDLVRRSMKESQKAPVVLVSHGPPQGRGFHAIDRIADKKNVGDPDLTKLLKKRNIPFGIFGHILEAGGRANGGALKNRIKPNQYSPKLYINAGSMSGDPWGMLDGSTSYGLAMMFEIKDGKARYRVKRFKSQF